MFPVMEYELSALSHKHTICTYHQTVQFLVTYPNFSSGLFRYYHQFKLYYKCVTFLNKFCFVRCVLHNSRLFVFVKMLVGTYLSYM